MSLNHHAGQQRIEADEQSHLGACSPLNPVLSMAFVAGKSAEAAAVSGDLGRHGLLRSRIVVCGRLGRVCPTGPGMVVAPWRYDLIALE